MNSSPEDQPSKESPLLNEYLAKLEETLGILRSTLGENGWWIIGSSARRGLLGIEPSYQEVYKENHFADLDVLVTEDKKSAFESLRQTATPIPLGGGLLGTYLRIEPLTDKGLPAAVDFSLGSDYKTSIPPETFKTIMVKQGNSTFPAVPRETLLALYSIVGKREKDLPKIEQLQKSVEEKPTEELDPTLYNFVKELENKKRPLTDVVAKGLVEQPLYLELRKRFPKVTQLFLGMAKKILYRKS